MNSHTHPLNCTHTRTQHEKVTLTPNASQHTEAFTHTQLCNTMLELKATDEYSSIRESSVHVCPKQSETHKSKKRSRDRVPEGLRKPNMGLDPFYIQT